ncbi:response regulator transcription factor [Curvibacter sp. RS43]|uniref:Response regulator transcription factor n=1 Tax=Curvibacter microcysteis TaxID=3026419 RepID=A0ABT5MKM1_9BURK|nr:MULTISPECIES: response regulator transcription factor [unclassified Curvibacter]MDD0811763.1 response regulator transcription factor [Curvibacter sp. RS43]MDD0816529.1 response regulator transcription factor [Curvibacter sp. HBC28]
MNTTPPPLRVLLADDHRIVREGLKQVFSDPANGQPEIRVQAEATGGAELLQLLASQGPEPALDVVVLDIAMPGQDGLELLQCLRQRWPSLPVLMLSTYPERQYAVRCLKLGASGYLNKSADPDDMVAAVRKVAAGGRYVSPATAEALAQALGPSAPGPKAAAGTLLGQAGIDSLSHREHQVFRLLSSGHSVTQIGAQLKLAVNTVSTYRTRVLEKTGARNDVELALLARGHPLE